MNGQLAEIMATMSHTEQYQAMFVDTLTGVLNRRAFDLLGVNRPWVALVDVDSLKWVNDTKGHREGDRYLILVADVLCQVFGQDNVFRVMGDEFVVYHDNLGQLARGFWQVRSIVPGLSVGLGACLARADAALAANKAKRAEWGHRAGRGEAPPWATRTSGHIR